MHPFNTLVPPPPFNATSQFTLSILSHPTLSPRPPTTPNPSIRLPSSCAFCSCLEGSMELVRRSLPPPRPPILPPPILLPPILLPPYTTPPPILTLPIDPHSPTSLVCILICMIRCPFSRWRGWWLITIDCSTDSNWRMSCLLPSLQVTPLARSDMIYITSSPCLTTTCSTSVAAGDPPPSDLLIYLPPPPHTLRTKTLLTPTSHTISHTPHPTHPIPHTPSHIPYN